MHILIYLYLRTKNHNLYQAQKHLTTTLGYDIEEIKGVRLSPNVLVGGTTLMGSLLIFSPLLPLILLPSLLVPAPSHSASPPICIQDILAYYIYDNV